MTRIKISAIFRGLLAWEAVIAVPFAIKLAVEAARPNAMYYIPGGWAIPAVGVLGILIALICSLAATVFGGLAAPIVGFILGAGCMAGLGWELASHGGFEAAALFPVSLLLSIPSGIGGAIAGSLNRRTARRIQKS